MLEFCKLFGEFLRCCNPQHFLFIIVKVTCITGTLSLWYEGGIELQEGEGERERKRGRDRK